MSARVFHDTRLANHRELYASRIAQIRLNLLGDVLRQFFDVAVGNLLVVDENPQLASGLNRESLVDAVEFLRDLLKVLQTLDVIVDRLPPCAGAPR